jgi:Helicase associated domain
LLRFRNLGTGEWGLLSNARCLGEGVDVPTIDGIAFIDPRRSTIDIIQALGRAIRKAPDKRLGTIVLPVFIADDDPERALEDSSFRCVWDVLKALRAHDEALGEELDGLRRALGRLASAPRRPGKIKLDLPAARVGAAFAEAFNTRLVEQTTATWDYWFGVLLAYVSRIGDSRVPTHYVEPNGYKLGYWVAAQRTSHNRGELSDARAKQLEGLPRWTWHTHLDAWGDGYERMRRFVAREGHADVPKGFVDQDGSRLDLWALHQRADHRTGKLTTERARRLEQLDGWKWEPDEAAFDDGLERLRRYVERHGNASVPNDYVDEAGFKLGLWVANRRKGYKKGQLAVYSIAALEAVPGWSWSLKGDAWEKGYERLRAFIDKHGHARVHKEYEDEDGYPVGSWVSNQRHQYAAGRLVPERAARLEATEGWLWATSGPRRRGSWEQSYDKLRRYVEKNSDARVPTDYVDEEGFGLGGWCVRQRTQYQEGRLSADRVAPLDRLGFLWDQRQHEFDRGLAELAAYIDANGDALVPQKHTTPAGFKLGTWCSERRKQHKAGQLSDERVAALDALGFVWDQKQHEFDRGLAELAEYVDANGDARVPTNHTTETGFKLVTRSRRNERGPSPRTTSVCDLLGEPDEGPERRARLVISPHERKREAFLGDERPNGNVLEQGARRCRKREPRTLGDGGVHQRRVRATPDQLGGRVEFTQHVRDRSVVRRGVGVVRDQEALPGELACRQGPVPGQAVAGIGENDPRFGSEGRLAEIGGQKMGGRDHRVQAPVAELSPQRGTARLKDGELEAGSLLADRREELGCRAPADGCLDAEPDRPNDTSGQIIA